MLILGVETSCDECSIAVVSGGRNIISNVIYSQSEHELYGGVVPEIASREHVFVIRDIFSKAISKAGIDTNEIDGIAVSQTPGLVGSLIVGYSFASSLSMALKKPFVGINHIHAHIYATHLENNLEYPYISLLLSGGHTLICNVKNYNNIEILGSTVDDSCGEAFDKVAKHYGLGYPGGPKIDKLAKSGDMFSYNFPHPRVDGYDVSYSGLKNAVINQTDKFYVSGKKTKEDIVASMQRVAIDTALSKLYKAMKDYGYNNASIGGGVGANSYLREQVLKSQYNILLPSLELCTDNGAMIAGLGYHYIRDGLYTPIGSSVNPKKIRGSNKNNTS